MILKKNKFLKILRKHSSKKNLDNPVIKKKVQNKKVAPQSNKKSKEITKTSNDKPKRKPN